MDVFVHIPKSCGSTIRGILSREYSVESIVYCEADSGSSPDSSLVAFVNNQMTTKDVRLITGHRQYGVHEIVKRPCRYFSMVRDPLERALSNYFYAYSYSGHLYRKQITVEGLTFEEFLALEANEASTSQSFLLAGPYPSQNISSAALENIGVGFTAVGVSERFDESLLYFAKTLGWGPPLYMRKNVTKLDDSLRHERRRLADLGPAHFGEPLVGDASVYLAAANRMDAWIREQGAPLTKAVQAFQELQRGISLCEDERVFAEYTFESTDELPDSVKRYIDSEAYRTVADYLQEPPKAIPRAHNYVGYVENCQGGIISGWAADLCSEIPIAVSVRCNDKEVSRLSCHDVRQDVQRAGFPMAVVGFSGWIPDLSDLGSEPSVFFDSSNLQLKRYSRAPR